MADNVEIAMLDIRAAHRGIGGQEKEIELEGGGPRLLELDGIVQPAVVGYAIEAGDHRDVERLGRAPQRLEMARDAVTVVRQLGKIARRLGAGMSAVYSVNMA